MATNTEFRKMMAKNVSFLYPRLDQPYRYNAQEKRTESCAETVQGAGYSLSWSMSEEDGKAFFREARDHYNAQREVNRKLPEFKNIFGMKKLDDGTVHFTAKKRAVSSQGKVNKAPVVVGPDLKDLPEKNIWSGSIGNIRVLAFPTTDPQGVGGISLLLDAVQVVEAKYGGDGLGDDFEIVDAPPAASVEQFDANAGKELADAEW